VTESTSPGGTEIADDGTGLADGSADPVAEFEFEADPFFDADDDTPLLPRRRHHVTTVVVAHDGAVWLPAVLTTLAQQTRQTNAVVGVDNASDDASAAVLTESLANSAARP
jgi:Glycosyltransferases involved in cell wall biogenesis